MEKYSENFNKEIDIDILVGYNMIVKLNDSGEMMDNKEFGLKIRTLREEKGITREDFCGDETELSVRQLARIESGESKPTLTKITFIAAGLGLSLYELMPDYVDLPEEYLALKYDVLRTPTYEENMKLDWRDQILSEIYDRFYDDLPEEEQLAVDTIQSFFDVHDTREAIYGKEILEEYFSQISHKEKYSINELLMSRLFLEHTRFIDLETSPREKFVFDHLLETLPSQVDLVHPNDLFILRDVLFVLVGVAGAKEEYQHISAVIQTIEQIMNRTQDYQKLPILKLICWKYEISVNNSIENARQFYEQASLAAQLIGDANLLERIEGEWRRDIEQNSQ